MDMCRLKYIEARDTVRKSIGHSRRGVTMQSCQKIRVNTGMVATDIITEENEVINICIYTSLLRIEISELSTPFE